MRLIRFWLLKTSISLALFIPNLALAEGCRLYVIKSMASPAAVRTLEKAGYSVQVTEQIPTVAQMNRFFDAAIAVDSERRTGFWVRIAEGGFASEMAYSQKGDFSDLPNCKQLPDFAAETYYNMVIGQDSRSRLDRYYQTHKISPGLGELILKSEALRMYGLKNYWPAYQVYKLRYDNLVKEARRTWDNSSQTEIPARLDEVRALLFNYYQHYVEAFHYMALLLEVGGFGNCESNTQLILATLIDAGIDLGKDYQLGAQLFNDHIQPILINNKTGQMTELTTGTLATRNAPVYSPELITFAIARAAGRAIFSEREFGLKLQNIDLKEMAIGPTLSYYVLDRRETPKFHWGELEYLRYDPVFSSLAERGQKNPNFASYEFNSIADPAKLKADSFAQVMPSAANRADEQADRKQGLLELQKSLQAKGDLLAGLSTELNKLLQGAREGHLGTSNGRTGKAWEGSSYYESLHADDLKILNSKYWAMFALDKRPDPQLQFEYTRSALIAHMAPDGRAPEYWQMSAIFHSRPANLDEISLIPEDMDFAFVPQNDPKPKEEVQLHAIKASVSYPSYKFIYRPQFQHDQSLIDPFHKSNIQSWMRTSFDKTVAIREHKIDLTQIVSWTRDKSTLLTVAGANLQKAHLAAFDYQDLSRVALEAEAMTQTTPLYWHQIRRTDDSCAIARNMQRMGIEFKSQPEATLNWIGDLDSESQQRFFNFFGFWNLFFKIADLGGCLDKLPEEGVDWDALKAPLDSLMAFVVGQTLNEGQVKVIKPQMISEVLIVPTLDDVAPLPPGKKAEQTRPGVLQNMVTPPAMQQEEGHQFKIRTETLYGLVATVSSKMLASPDTQLALAKLWSPGGQSYFKSVWWNVATARENFLNAWTWSPFINIPEWMSPAIAKLATRLSNVPGVYASIGKHELATYTRVPNYLLEDLKEAAKTREIDVKVFEMLPETQLKRTTTNQKDYQPAKGEGCSEYTFNMSGMDSNFGAQVRALNALPNDFRTFSWERKAQCSNMFSSNPTEFESIGISKGSVNTQRISVNFYSLEPGGASNQMRLTTYSKEQSVQDALKDDKSDDGKSN